MTAIMTLQSGIARASADWLQVRVTTGADYNPNASWSRRASHDVVLEPYGAGLLVDTLLAQLEHRPPGGWWQASHPFSTARHRQARGALSYVEGRSGAPGRLLQFGVHYHAPQAIASPTATTERLALTLPLMLTSAP